MDQPLAHLIAAALAFVGSHFALSHPFRMGLVRRLGAGGFQGLYSLVALASFGWIIWAFRHAGGGEPLWNGGAALIWALASVLMLIASVLLAGSFAGNPALPAPGAAALAEVPPKGVFLTTRHPMMWSMALWSAAHAAVSPSPRVLVLALAIAALALIGAHLQDRKKEVLMGKAWGKWEARTSYWPKFPALAGVGLVPWLGGTVLWLVATWGHIPTILVPAGVWRWVL